MSIATCSLQQDVLLIECFTEKSTLFPHCFQSQIVVRHGLMFFYSIYAEKNARVRRTEREREKNKRIELLQTGDRWFHF